MHRSIARRAPGLLAAAALMAACALLACSTDAEDGRARSASDEAASTGSGFGNTPAPSAPGASGASGAGAADAAASAQPTSCTRRNLTRACACDGVPGSQVCDGASWAPCTCGGAAAGAAGPGGNFAGNLRTDIEFDWERIAFTEGGDCPPGDYEGNFQGIYYSYIAAVSGIPGLGVPIINLELTELLEGAGSGFRFTVAPAEGGETVQRVEGVMQGTADGLFPFVADIEGELDCATGMFIADMKMGRYSVLADGLVPQSFEGIMTGRFDYRTATLVDGIWDVRETTAMPPGELSQSYPRDFARDGYGGSGEWAAALPTDLNDPDLRPCASPHQCLGGPLGPRKLLCGDPLLGPPICFTDADCEAFFPGEGVTCLNASALSICLRECTP